MPLSLQNQENSVDIKCLKRPYLLAFRHFLCYNKLIKNDKETLELWITKMLITAPPKLGEPPLNFDDPFYYALTFKYENKDESHGFPVLNGQGINEKFITKYKVNKDDSIVLASDGSPVLENSLEASENALKHILESDPLRISEYKATKGVKPGNVSFDDRVYCKIQKVST